GVSDAPRLGKLAVVTGASRGIGLAVAEELQAAGAHVVRLARSLVEASAGRRTDLPCDVTDPAAVARAAARILAERGVPDVVVNNAGIFFIKPVADTTPDDFARTISVNLTGPFLIARTFVPHLVRRGTGHVVTIGSVSDHVPYTGSTAYAASKYGLRGMHEVLRAELSRTGVRTTLRGMLRCPEPHGEAFLVMSTGEMHGRMVRSGILGCPICRREFPIVKGIVDCSGKGKGETGSVGDTQPTFPVSRFPFPAVDPETLQALLDLSGPGGYVVLVGAAARHAVGLAGLMGGIHFIG